MIPAGSNSKCSSFGLGFLATVEDNDWEKRNIYTTINDGAPDPRHGLSRQQ